MAPLPEVEGGVNCDRKAFDELLFPFAVALQEAKPHQRASGGNKAHLLSAEEKLFYILCHFKCYTTCDAAVFLFDFNRFQANFWIITCKRY